MMTRALVPIGAVIIVVAAPEASAQQPASADVHNKKGTQLFNRGRYAEAIAEYEAAYAIAPRPKYLFNIALAHLRQGKKQEALSYFRRYLDEDPKGAGSDEAREHVRTLTKELAEEQARAAPPPAPAPVPTPEPAAPASPEPAPAAAAPPLQAPPETATASAALAPRPRPVLRAFGPKLGVLASTVSNLNESNDKLQFGVGGGGFVTFGAADWLGIEIELLYAPKGAATTDTGYGDLGLPYLELPILLQPSYRGLFAEVGPYLSFLLDNNPEYIKEKYAEESGNAKVQRLDVGLVLGAGYALRIGSGALLLQARFDLGLAKLKERASYTNRTFSLSVGYSFR